MLVINNCKMSPWKCNTIQPATQQGVGPLRVSVLRKTHFLMQLLWHLEQTCFYHCYAANGSGKNKELVPSLL